MKTFRQYLVESTNSPDLSVDFHLAGHFGSGKSTAIEKSGISKRATIIDLDTIDEELQKKYGSKPTDDKNLKFWHEKFKNLYIQKVVEAKKLNKPIGVVGHHYEGDLKFAPIDAKQKFYIDLPKEQIFDQRRKRDSSDKNLTDEYLNTEYEMVQDQLDRENYEPMSFEEIVKQLKQF